MNATQQRRLAQALERACIEAGYGLERDGRESSWMECLAILARNGVSIFRRAPADWVVDLEPDRA